MLRHVLLASALAALTVGARLMAQGNGNAARLRQDIDAIAELAKAGKNDQASKQAAVFARAQELDEIMHLYNSGKKAGLGIGPAANPVPPNDIYKALRAISVGAMPAVAVFAEPQAFDEMAWRMVALSDVVTAKAPQANNAKKLRKDWLDASDQSQKAALDFSAAIAARNPNLLRNAATRSLQACNSCHSIFR